MNARLFGRTIHGLSGDEMYKYVLAACALICASSAPAFAQTQTPNVASDASVVQDTGSYSPLSAPPSFPKVDLYGGYSFLATSDPRFNAHGWEGSATANINSWFGLETAVNGHYRRKFEHYTPVGLPAGFEAGEGTNRHSVVVGPRFTLRSGRVAAFAHAMVGVAHESRDGLAVVAIYSRDSDEAPLFTPLPIRTSETGVAFVLGGGLDVRLTKRLSLRVAQVDYAPTTLYSGTQGARASAGFVVHLGRK